MNLNKQYLLKVILVYLSGVLSVYLTFPGAIYTDTIVQFKDLLSGVYGSWQMPVMVGTWALIHKIFPWAPANFFIFQNLLFVFAFHLILRHFKDNKIVSWGIVVLCFSPPVLVSNAVLWKDTQMASSYLLGLGLLLNYFPATSKYKSHNQSPLLLKFSKLIGSL